MHGRQNSEFVLRGAVQTPVQVLQSATITAARLMRQEGQIGEIVAGAWADLLVVEGDPTVDASLMAEPARTIKLLMQGGRIVEP
jgi:imidazolonepropionase-like amidohydrolase